MLTSLFFRVQLVWQILLLKVAKRPAPSEAKPNERREPVSFPLQETDFFNGFVNSKRNTYGLQAEFFVQAPNLAFCRWENTAEYFQGFPGIIHGGVLVALSDELMANWLVGNLKRIGVSLSMSVKWLRPLTVGETAQGHAEMCARIGNFILLRATILNSSGKAVLTAKGIFYLPTAAEFERMVRRSLPEELRKYCGEA